MAKKKPKDDREEIASEVQPDRKPSKDKVPKDQLNKNNKTKDNKNEIASDVQPERKPSKEKASKDQLDKKKKPKDDREEIVSEVQPERKPSQEKAPEDQLDNNPDLSTPETHKELSEHEVFTGDEDFYKLLANSQDTESKESNINRQSLKWFSLHKSFTLLQKVLILGIFAIILILLYVIFGLKSGPIQGPKAISAAQSETIGQQEHNLLSQGNDSKNVKQEQINKPSLALPPTQPLSLKVARDYFRQKDYNHAYAVYNQLCEALPDSEEMMRDFLRLQMALCLEVTKDYEKASHLYVMISESRSPLVRIVANYRLSLLEIQRKRYLHARTRAYKALALVKAIDFNNDWALAFECDCHYLAAECLTRHVLLLNNADHDIPNDLWSKPDISSVLFDNLSESQLRSLLYSGSEHLEMGLLDPKIIELEERNVLSRWSIISNRVPIEELLSKFAASADLDLHWAYEEGAGLSTEPDIIRLSPATIYLPSTNSQKIVLIAAGCTGLLAQMEETPDKQQVTISNPADYSSLDEHVSFLGRHAISLWRKFILTFNSEKRLGNAHFAMGLLQSQIGMEAGALAEYKLVANRFSQMSLSPFALLHSSRIKADLRDYQGSQEDLKQLIEQYPDTEIYGQAYLRLADVTKLAGLNAEAAQLYSRVYHFGLSYDSKTASAFGAAGCFYKIEAYQEAAKWLTRYIDLAKDDHNNFLYSAYFLLGKTNLALGKYEQASYAFQYALTEQNSREQYVEAVKALVQGHIEQENFVKALDALENTRSVALSEEQSVDVLLLKSKIYRMLGLADTAIDTLRNRAEYVTDPRLNIKITYEIAKCYADNDKLELARDSFSEILRTVEPGPLAENTALELADICLKLDQSSQSASVCLQLLDSDVSSQTKQKTLNILAEAYNQQKDYDKAALALSGQW